MWMFMLYSNLLQTYVRDIYPFRRSVSPQLNLVHMLPEKGQELIQKQVRKMIEWIELNSLHRSKDSEPCTTRTWTRSVQYGGLQ